MKQTVDKGKTMFVDGPACIHLLSGEASILGASVKCGERIIVRKGKRMAFEALCKSEVEVILGDSASCVTIDGSSIPPSWKDALNEILTTSEPKTVLVMGGTDSGKSSFSTYLANLALNAGFKVSLIDGDLGQSDIGPPGTVSLTIVEEPVLDLFKLRFEDLIFLGVTNPSRKVPSAIDAIVTLKEEALKRNTSLLIINTDGWVEGEDAVKYKISTVKKATPNIVIAIQSGDELAPILGSLKDVKTITINSPQNIKERDREARKRLRESAYKKYLREAKVRSFPLSFVEAIGDMKLNSENRSQLKRRVEELLGKKILHCDTKSDCILLVLEKETDLGGEEIRKVETESGKQVFGLHEGDESGILVALEDAHGKVLGIGTIHNIDCEKKMVRVYTPVGNVVSRIRIGRIKLDKEGKEIGLIHENL